MRFIGLTLCLLASTFGARAESLEERVAALEARVKVLESASAPKVQPITAANLDGTYKGVLPNGSVITAIFEKGKVVADDGTKTQTGTYEVVGQKVLVTFNGKTDSATIEGNHLTTDNADRIQFTKSSATAPVANVDGSYEAILDGKTIKLELTAGKAIVYLDQDTKSGTYQLVGDHLVVTIEDKPETLSIEGDHLRAQKGSDKIDFAKTK